MIGEGGKERAEALFHRHTAQHGNQNERVEYAGAACAGASFAVAGDLRRESGGLRFWEGDS